MVAHRRGEKAKAHPACEQTYDTTTSHLHILKRHQYANLHAQERKIGEQIERQNTEARTAAVVKNSNNTKNSHAERNCDGLKNSSSVIIKGKGSTGKRPSLILRQLMNEEKTTNQSIKI